MILTFVSPIIVRKYDSYNDELYPVHHVKKYLDTVNSAIIRCMLDNQEERWLEKGLVAYSDSALIYEYVTVARLCAKIIDGQLSAVIQCVLQNDDLPKTIGRHKFEKLIEDIKNELTGQFSDGFGENLEQRAIRFDDEEIYISLWDYENWDMKLLNPPSFDNIDDDVNDDDGAESIKDATFISIWDDGICISSPCKVNIKTHEIFDIGENDYPGDDGELDILQSEWVRIDEEEFLACPQEYVEFNKSSYADGKDRIVYGY